MKRVLWVMGILAATAQLRAAPISQSDLVVYRVGDGSAALSSSSTVVYVDEYTPSGTLVQSFQMPTVNSGSQYALTASGSATSEGYLTLSGNGQYIMLTGYGTNVGVASIASSTSLAAPRVVGRLDLSGNLDTSTSLTNFTSGNNVRSVYSTDGTNIWVSGASTGIGYTTAGSRSALQLGTGLTNVRMLNGTPGSSGQLYFSDSSGSTFRLGTAGPGFPTTSGQIYTNLPGLPSNIISPYAFIVLDLSLSIAGADTLYYADDVANAIFKYSFNGTTWTSNGFISAASPRGLTAILSDNNVSLFGTGGSTTVQTNLISFADTTGYNGAVSGAASVIAYAPANEVFRGIAAVPEPSTVALVFAGVGTLAMLRRRRTL